MASKRPIDIVVADKSPIVQAGLRAMFEADPRFHLVAAASDGERFLEAVERLSFDVGVIGWEMPFLDGRGVLEALRQDPDAPRIVVYTGTASRHAAREAMQLGAAGFCHKSDAPERLAETVIAAADGRMLFPFTAAGGKDNDPLAALTTREQELLGAIAQGNTNGQIARNLGISVNTVKFHLKNLFEKLGVRSRAQAVAKYLRH